MLIALVVKPRLGGSACPPVARLIRAFHCVSLALSRFLMADVNPPAKGTKNRFLDSRTLSTFFCTASCLEKRRIR